MRPCIHGEVCRAYMKKFGLQNVTCMVPAGIPGMRVKVKRTQVCILSNECPNGCKFYRPVPIKNENDREETR